MEKVGELGAIYGNGIFRDSGIRGTSKLRGKIKSPAAARRRFLQLHILVL